MTKQTLNLDEYRNGSEKTWNLPTWSHPLTQGVFPLCVEVEDHLFPIGSCFVVSRLGIIMSAAHNAYEAFKYHWNGDKLRAGRKPPDHYNLSDIGFFVLHHRYMGNDRVELNLWPITNINIDLPTDLMIGLLQPQPGVPRLASEMCFGVPRIGEQLRCVGFAEMMFPVEGIPLVAVREGSFDWQNLVDYQFRVSAGAVKRIFVQRFATGFIEGPCAVIDATVEHGQSGGPVVNEDGQVCGVVSAGATHFFEHDASIVSLLYPSLASRIRYTKDMDTYETDLLSLCLGGYVLSHGIEKGVAFTEYDETFAVSPLIHPADAEFVHDDFRGFQAGLQATRQKEQAFRIRGKERDMDSK